MSLQVWLPLNGDLTNQGLTPVTVTVSGSTAFNTSGKIGQSLTCNGSSFWTINPIVLSNTKASICCWVKTSVDGKMLWVIEATSSDRLNLWQSQGVYYLNTADSTRNPFVNNGTNVTGFTDGQWHHLAVVFDNNNICKIYKDGIYAGAATTFKSPATSSTNTIKLAGGYDNTHNYDWDGSINDFRIYDHALSAEEVRKISQGLILHYPLNDRMIQPRQNLFSLKNSTVTNDSDWTQISSTSQNAYLSENYSFSKENNILTAVASSSSSTTNMRYPFYISYFSSSNTRLLENKIIKFSCYLRAYSDDDIGKRLNLSFMIPSISSSRIAGIAHGTTTNKNVTLTKFWKKFSITTQTLTTDDPSKNQNFWIRSVVPANSPGVSLQMKQPMLEYLTDDNDPGSSLWLPGGQNTIENIVYDISGFKNHGTIIGDLTANVDTPRYQCSTSFIQTGSKSSGTFLTAPNQITVSAWVKRSTATSQYPIIFSGPSKYALWLNGSTFYFRDNVSGTSGTSGTVNSAYLATLSTTDWNFVAFIYDKGTYMVYVNGQVKDPPWTNNASENLINLVKVYVGGSSVDYPFSGSVSDFRVYCTALDKNQLDELYQLGHV